MYRILTRLAPPFFFSILLLCGRIFHTGSITFSFLVWNQFLALLPVFLAYYCLHASSNGKALLYGTLWLLFFPNAPYLITDLVHLRERADIPLWYDLLLLSTASVNGILSCFISLSLIEKRIRNIAGKRYLNPLIFALMLLCGFGIYLGRFQRWNSWDIITSPMALCTDIVMHIINPLRYANAWMLTVLFATWLYLMYQFAKRPFRTDSFFR